LFLNLAAVDDIAVGGDVAEPEVLHTSITQIPGPRHLTVCPVGKSPSPARAGSRPGRRGCLLPSTRTGGHQTYGGTLRSA
jgi:hypothetical protein